MPEREIGFPINPKEQINTALSQYSVDSVDFTWQVLLAAAAQADRRTYKSASVDQQGIHTAVVNELLEPLETTAIEPAQLEDFGPYFQGLVWPRWSERHDKDNLRGRAKFFAYRARKETLDQAELHPDVYLLLSSGVNQMECRSYMEALTGGISSLVPDDDFPYRSMKTGEEVKAFWNHLITGKQNQPGALKAAAALEQQARNVDHLVRQVFGNAANLPLARGMLELVLHVQTSKRRSNETARSILTPLLQAFNSRKLETVTETLTQFALNRPELVPLGFDRFLNIDRRTMASEQRRTEATTKVAKKTELNDDFTALRWSIDGRMRSQQVKLSESVVDQATNRYVETKRWRTYLLNYQSHRHERVVLLEVEDSMVVNPNAKVSVLAPRLNFLKLEETGDETDAKVVTCRINAKKFFKQLGHGPIMERDIDIEGLKRIALAWGKTNLRTPLLVEFIQSLEDTRAE
jgi:hypothetical protein